jgi:hypothetical protein
MFRTALATMLVLLPLAAFAQQDGITTPPRDAKIEMVASDLHALGRIATLASDLRDARQVLLAITDQDIQSLRMPREDGTFQWAALERIEGGRVKDEVTVEQVHSEETLRNVTVTASNGYRVLVSVPQKRGVFAANNRVWVRNVLVDSTDANGKTTHTEIPVNAWVNPGDANGVALPDIGTSVKATAELGVESGSKKAVAEVALLQAKLIDDPASPWFPAVRRLLQIRELAAAEDINRGQLKTTIDEALLSVPGELEKRTAEQAEAAKVRLQMAEMGTTTGSIALGDATPDVVKEMAEISRLLAGTLEEQASGRTRLDALTTTLAPKPAEEAVVPVP